MANHKATKKDTRQASKRRERNRYYGKTTRNAIRDLKEVKDEKAYGESLPNVILTILSFKIFHRGSLILFLTDKEKVNTNIRLYICNMVHVTKLSVNINK